MSKGIGLLREFLQLFQVDLSAAAICPTTNASRSAAIERQSVRMRKRAQLGSSKVLIEKAKVNFLAINDEMAEMKLSLTSEEISEASDFISNCLWRYTSLLDENAFQCSVTSTVIQDNWRHGPGASNGTIGTHVAEKLDSTYSATKHALPYVIAIRRSYTYHNVIDNMKGLGIRLIHGSRLTFVPKNEESVRTIAIEPSGNMCCQLAVGRHIEESLRYVGLDITNQSVKNKNLARLGSLYGNLATLDLSSASDRIHPSLVRALFPADMFELLMNLRSPTTQLDGKEVRLNMISTMGNGTTFPVMTLLIAGLVYANRRVNFDQRRRNFIDWSSTGIFGDDIIVNKEEVPHLVSLLSRAGLVVNDSKSFSDGPFRESCGGDYYNGVDITPVYVKALTSEPEIYTVVNRLLSWCSAHNVELPRTLPFLRRLLPKVLCFVPEWMPIESGIRTSGCPRRFRFLRVTAARKRLRNEFFAVSLAAGGYVESRAGTAFYVSRESVKHICRLKGQLPKGWLTGWDPFLRTQREADHVMQLIADYL